MRRPFHIPRLALAAVLAVGGGVAAQRPPAPRPALPVARPEATDRVLPINLATALQLAHARPLDVQIAARQVSIAARQLDRARLLWVPNLVTGLDYFRHDGLQQNFTGDVVGSSRGSLGVGVGPNVVFNLSDAIHGPLVARQDLLARRAQQQAVANDATLAVAEAYFGVQQARGELAGATVALEKAEEVARNAEKLAEGLAPPLEANRAMVELARRRQAVAAVRERWRVASAELVRLLRLEPGTLVEPLEPANLTIPIIDPTTTLDALIPIGLTNRPELASHQAVVQAALARLKQEKLRPLVPSIALRSVSTNPSGSIGWAGFGGGANDKLNGFGSRFDLDLQVMWEFQSLGLGNRARVGERRAEQEAAILELFRAQDRVAAEVSTAFAQAKAAAERLAQSEPALKAALELVDRSLQGMTQTRRVGTTLVLVVRPQEVVAAVQALGQANADHSSAIGDYNRAQFRLYRALGHPGHSLAGAVPQVAADTDEPPLPAPKPLTADVPVSFAPAVSPTVWRAPSSPPGSPAHPPLLPLVVTPRVQQVAAAPAPLRDAMGTLPPPPSFQPRDAVAARPAAAPPSVAPTFAPLPPKPVTVAAKVSPWDLPLTRHVLTGGRGSVQQATHREPAARPDSPPGSADMGWQPILPNTGTPTPPGPLALSVPPVPLPALPATVPPTDDGLKWEPIRPADPPKKRYESLFR